MSGRENGSPGEFDPAGPPLVEPAPDEDAWEAYVGFALDHLGEDVGPGVTNRELATIEALVGHRLPFEVGLLLVVGVPENPPWWQWHDDPSRSWSAWTTGVRDALLADVDDGYWSTSWGPRPAGAGEGRDLAAALLAEAAPLFPLWSDRAVPLGAAEGHESSDGNPVLVVRGAQVLECGVDLAAWMHSEFGVPLPMWPPDHGRRFPFWSDL